jgi:hypothetical protein
MSKTDDIVDVAPGIHMLYSVAPNQQRPQRGANAAKSDVR